MQFTYHNPTRLHFGRNQFGQIGREIPKDAKVLVLFGGGSIQRNGVYDQVSQALSAHQWLDFGGIEPNPSIETLDGAVKKVQEEQIDYLLAVGGGSVIDGAKYIAAAACYSGYGWDILDGSHKVRKALPVGAVLTLPATGSESNGAAVITRTATHEKRSFLSPLVQPAFAILDPTVMRSLPDRQLSNGIIDAFVHICEQYLTEPTEAVVQEGYAEVLLRNLVALARSYDHRAEDGWQENLMWTANQSLNGLIGAGVPQDWSTHAIGHELTAVFGMDHAQTLAVVLPALLEEMIINKRAKLTQMGERVFGLSGEAVAEQTIVAIEDLFRSIGAATRLNQHHISRNDVATELLPALQAHARWPLGEKRDIDLARCEAILMRAVG
ncbi:iron-containing alcohol dehydrogenase [Ferrimonas marina]|uniref:NADP-dependent alcohol dehydrogenase n=1 Tax=Ferrimonas marina TaxID=299255 RepID=A0A1M5R6B4_9GAMM|nr:iron-containing alcohol dehydrogenase [Ferrimonas marina]SHH21499.1 NADP-dependent alcohol dehydrogenase [Ferrimonas marina]